MPFRSSEFYDELRALIDDEDSQPVIQKILDLPDKTERVYAVSRLYKELYPHFDKALEINEKESFGNILRTVLANAFLFDLSLSLIERTDLDMDIRSDLQHAQSLKRMVNSAISDALEANYTEDSVVVKELQMTRMIVESIIEILRAVLSSD